MAQPEAVRRWDTVRIEPEEFEPTLFLRCEGTVPFQLRLNRYPTPLKQRTNPSSQEPWRYSAEQTG